MDTDWQARAEKAERELEVCQAVTKLCCESRRSENWNTAIEAAAHLCEVAAPTHGGPHTQCYKALMARAKQIRALLRPDAAGGPLTKEK